jgi:hypothetical protein
MRTRRSIRETSRRVDLKVFMGGSPIRPAWLGRGPSIIRRGWGGVRCDGRSGGGPEGAAQDEVEGGFVLGVFGFGEAAGDEVGLNGEELVFEGLEEWGWVGGCGGSKNRSRSLRSAAG